MTTPLAAGPLGPAASEDPGKSVEVALAAFLAQQRTLLLGVSDELAVIGDLASAALQGGKRLRPLFCCWGFRAAGAVPGPELFRAAAALELLQACALVHDDVIDASDTRRGRPAVHRLLQSLHSDRRWSGDPARFGVGTAILVGDLFLVWSDQMFTASGLPAVALGRGRPLFDLMRTELMAGQYLDVVAQSLHEPDPAAIATVLRFKSAKYSVERPLQLGAALAGGSDELLAGLSAFGLPIGEAFQLRDDLLGVFGDPRVTGKPAGDDLREGKRTMLIAHAYSHADDAQRATLASGLGAGDLDDRGVAHLRSILLATGAVAEVEAQIEQRRTLALRALDQLHLDPEPDAALRSLAAAAIDRDR